MITVDERQVSEFLVVDEITFAIPAQSFAIACAISAEEALPVVTEFALRIAYVCGDLSPTQVQEFFGFSKKETDAVIQSLLSERLLQWSDDHLELTSYALTRFQDSSDNLPRFFKIQDWSAEVVFDLISFTPAGRPTRLKKVRSQVELAPRNLDKQSRTIQYAEQAFQQHFRKICTKDKAEIYKITAVDSGEHFSIPLPCSFYLDLDGQTSVRRSIDDESFGERLEISEAITDALASHDRGNNDGFLDFIRIFDDALLAKYVSDDAFDLRKYVIEVHLSKVATYNDSRVQPMLGAPYLPRNAELLLERMRAELIDEGSIKVEGDAQLDRAVEEADPSNSVTVTNPDALWWGTASTLWARSRSARELSQKIDHLLVPRQKKELSHGGLRVVVPVERSSAKHRLSIYRDQFTHLIGAEISLMSGSVELLLVPERFVCAMFHFHLAHQPIAIPVGFVSSHPGHIKAAAALVAERVMLRRDALHPGRETGGHESIEDFVSLAERILPPKPTKDGRARLSLKKQ